MSQPTLSLYDHPVSSYAQKTRIILRHKNLPFTSLSPFNFAAASADATFLAHNPRGEVPVLLVQDSPSAPPFPVVDSRVIAQYLEDRFPASTPVFPASPEAKANARAVELLCDTQYEAVNWGLGEVSWMKRGSPDTNAHLYAEAERQTRAIYTWLESRIDSSGWLAGPAFSIADAAAAPIVHRSVYFGYAPVAGSKLAAWLERVREVPAVRMTLAEFDENVGNMGMLADTFLSGRRKREYRDYRLEFLVKSGGVKIVLDGLRDGNVRFPWPEGRGREE